MEHKVCFSVLSEGQVQAQTMEEHWEKGLKYDDPFKTQPRRTATSEGSFSPSSSLSPLSPSHG